MNIHLNGSKRDTMFMDRFLGLHGGDRLLEYQAAHVADSKSLAEFQQDVIGRVRDIQACKHPNTSLYLQTTPSRRSRFDAAQYNNRLRRIAAMPQIGLNGLLDFDSMLSDGELDIAYQPPAELASRFRGHDDDHVSATYSQKFAH